MSWHVDTWYVLGIGMPFGVAGGTIASQTARANPLGSHVG
jgi:hypothetical protein